MLACWHLTQIGRTKGHSSPHLSLLACPVRPRAGRRIDNSKDSGRGDEYQLEGMRCAKDLRSQKSEAVDLELTHAQKAHTRHQHGRYVFFASFEVPTGNAGLIETRC